MEQSLALSLILQKEIEVLEQIPPLQLLIRDAVIKREWADYETLMHSVSEIGSHFEVLEQERETVFKNMAKKDESFHSWAERLPGKEREAISILYRKLKMTSLQIKISNDTLMEYLREVKTTVSGLIDRVYPSRRGKLYSKDGIEREADMRSVVVNSSL